MLNVFLQTERERIPVMEAFQTRSAKRCLFLGLGLMIFQQFSGVNAVIFYSTSIFNVIQYNNIIIKNYFLLYLCVLLLIIKMYCRRLVAK